MMSEPQSAERSLARLFFEIGYGACWADAFIKNDETPPFEMTDAVIERAWEIAPEAHDDRAEWDRGQALADAAPELLKIVEIFLGHDERFQVSVGGNPNAVDAMLDNARSVYAKVTGAE